MAKYRSVVLTGDQEIDTKRITYTIFISAVAILSLMVAIAYYIVPDAEIRQVLLILDTFYAIVFFIDFLLRLHSRENRRHYFFHWGWLDLVTAVPGIPALRIIRSVLIVRSARLIASETPQEIVSQAKDRIAESVFLIIVYIGMIVLTVGSVLIVYVEADAPGSVITTGSDAIWWSLVTVSTVGYGDEYPVTNAGRIIGIFMIVVGVALFTSLTSFLASSFTGRSAAKQRQEQIETAQATAARIEDLLDRILQVEEQLAKLVPADDAPDQEDP